MRDVLLHCHWPDAARPDTPTQDPHTGSSLHFGGMKQSQPKAHKTFTINISLSVHVHDSALKRTGISTSSMFGVLWISCSSWEESWVRKAPEQWLLISLTISTYASRTSGHRCLTDAIHSLDSNSLTTSLRDDRPLNEKSQIAIWSPSMTAAAKHHDKLMTKVSFPSWDTLHYSYMLVFSARASMAPVCRSWPCSLLWQHTTSGDSGSFSTKCRTVATYSLGGIIATRALDDITRTP